MGEIIGVQARQILDSRGNPTVEVDIYLEDGLLGRAAVPSGASTGSREAIELRDGNAKVYMGKGVEKAVKNVNTKIAPELVGIEVTEQALIDKLLIEIDGTKNKSKLGANAMLGVSLAVAKAAANDLDLPLFKYIGGTNACEMPVPMMNVLNGGAHADNNVDIQEFMIMPVGAKSFSEALRMGTEIFHHLKAVLKKKKYNTAVGDEGGFAPDLKSNAEAVEVLIQAVKSAGYKIEKDVLLALDVAASELYANNKYTLAAEKKSKLSSGEMVSFLEKLVKKYPIVSVEDGLAENDWKGWKQLTDKVGGQTQLVGDDIFVTNTEILAEGHPAGHRQLHPDQGQSNRYFNGNAGSGRNGETGRIYRRYLPPVGGNGRHHHCRYRGGRQCRPDQNRFVVPDRPGCKIQPTAPDRRSPGVQCGL